MLIASSANPQNRTGSSTILTPVNNMSTTTSIASTSLATTSASATSTPVTFSDPFVIRAEDVSPGVKKRAIRYVDFAGDDAIVESYNNLPLTKFILASNGSLYTYADHKFVGTVEKIGLQFVSKFLANPLGAQIWTRDTINRLRLLDSLRFCVDGDSRLRAIFPGPPSAILCLEVNLFGM